jgi:hypothetical protein
MIKHSKYKNTGILFELLVRQATSDLMSNKDSKAIKIFKRYFNDTELGKELNLYNIILNSEKLNETKANILITTVLEEAKKLDRKTIDKQKYSLIKEIKKNYDLDNFFKAKIDTYKFYASVYTLIESQLEGNIQNTNQIIANKLNLLEHVTKETLTERKVASKVVEEFLKEDKEIRLLAYKILVEKFNDKYNNLSLRQKNLLKEYINNISDTKQLKSYLNTQLEKVKKELTTLKEKVEDKVVKIKLNEVLTFIKPLGSNESIKDEVLVGLMQYYALIDELKNINNVQ